LLLRAIESLLAGAAAHRCPGVFYDAHTVEWACFPKSKNEQPATEQDNRGVLVLAVLVCALVVSLRGAVLVGRSALDCAIAVLDRAIASGLC